MKEKISKIFTVLELILSIIIYRIFKIFIVFGYISFIGQIDYIIHTGICPWIFWPELFFMVWLIYYLFFRVDHYKIVTVTKYGKHNINAKIKTLWGKKRNAYNVIDIFYKDLKKITEKYNNSGECLYANTHASFVRGILHQTIGKEAESEFENDLELNVSRENFEKTYKGNMALVTVKYLTDKLNTNKAIRVHLFPPRELIENATKEPYFNVKIEFIK